MSVSCDTCIFFFQGPPNKDLSPRLELCRRRLLGVVIPSQQGPIPMGYFPSIPPDLRWCGEYSEAKPKLTVVT